MSNPEEIRREGIINDLQSKLTIISTILQYEYYKRDTRLISIKEKIEEIYEII